MKLFTVAAAGMVALTGLAPVALTSPASAQRTVVTERTVVHTERHDGPRWRTRKACNWKYRNHHRVRVCRTVRYR